jgi:hypothetical protein
MRPVLARQIIRLASLLSAAGVAAVAACSSQPVSLERTNFASLPIAQEQPNGIAQVSSRIYNVGSDAALNATFMSASMPTMDFGSCSAEMIGPNVGLSASHCGDSTTHVLSFYTYRNLGTTADSEDFSCQQLVNTFGDSDMLVMYCPPNAAGVSPGDKYGYLDIDHSAPAINNLVYSYWYNNITSLGGGLFQIYSTGAVTSITDSIWGPPNASLISKPLGIGMNTWTSGGGSGSPNLSAASNRLWVGPTDTGPGTEGPGRDALSLKSYLEQGTVPGWTDGSGYHSGLNGTAIQSLGLAPSSYSGRLDKNNDYLIDIQKDLEVPRGENARDWYDLGFFSERRNALWTASSAVTFDPLFGSTNGSFNGAIHINSVNPPTAGVTILSHTGLHLKANTTYRVTYQANTSNAGAYVNLVARSGGVIQASHTLSLNPSGGSYVQDSFSISTVSANSELALVAMTSQGTGTLTSDIVALSVVEQNSVMNFDTQDKRQHWRNDNNGRRAVIVPDGETTGTPNWAALAMPTTPFPAGGDWPLRNRQLAILGASTQGTPWYQYCFDHKVGPATGVFADTDVRTMRLLSSGTQVGYVNFSPTATWANTCTPPIHATSGDNNIQFGFGGSNIAHGYYIDNVTITSVPCPALTQCPVGDNCGRIGDGCGGSILCGAACNSPQVCRSNHCTTCCPSGCTAPKTCQLDICACGLVQ